MNDDLLDDSVRNMYHGWAGKGFHPNSPSGGGGPGFFMPAEQFGVCLMRPDSLPHPYSPASAALTPNQIKQKVTEPEPIKLTDLPSVMRKKGWPVGAAVMEKWLAGSMRKMTKDEKTGDIPVDKYPPEFIDTKLITWKWLINFEIVREGKENLAQKLTRNNEKTLLTLQKILKKQSSRATSTVLTPLTEISITNLAIRNLKDSIGTDLGALIIPGVLNKERLKSLIANSEKNVLNKITNATNSAAAAKAAKANKTIANDKLSNILTTAESDETAVKEAKKENAKYKAIVTLFEEMPASDFSERKHIKKVMGDLTYASYTAEFKNKVDPVFLHAHWQFQLATIKRAEILDYFRGNANKLDDLDAALHVFGLYAAIIAGKVTDYGVGKPFSATVLKIGIYMRDTYDFLDKNPSESQYLAHWGYDDVTVNATGKKNVYKSWNGNYMWPIHNSDYIKYQNDNKKGGDLMLFSDIETISSNIEFDW